ncbi:uncharacterized protein K452DRAFT_244600 [Aplosporella prunicola CBS 121167]|uniref:L domain-like protein n=1 Tax=Aplosporella prunicola CBS 121167 TaxID=1176127 RepID=A0A6A6BNM4_9PEZI|nr:uncharacterized protein K452DRAFT_244600 [Aplosporella prunicola CBS 121167]KAF2145023.1 hypothetical protein K452DRAFT_244600 [Aplosporella prunicola CBS 121167]
MDSSSSRIPRPPSAIPRPSSLPRPSKLPQPKLSAIPTPPKPRSKPSIPAPSGIRPPSRITSPAKETYGFKKPLPRPESRQARSRIVRPVNGNLTVNAETEDDTLGDLDGFRVSSMSRQGFRDDESDFGVDDDDVLSQHSGTKSRKFSQSSLSERAVESLSHILPTSPSGSRSSSFFGGPASPRGPSRPASAMSRSRPDSRNSTRPPSRTGMYRSASQRPTTPTMGPPSSGYGQTRAASAARPASRTSFVGKNLAPTPQRSASAAPRSPAEFSRSESSASPTEDQEPQEELLKSPSSRLSKMPQDGSDDATMRKIPKTRPVLDSAFGEQTAGETGTMKRALTSVKRPKAAAAAPADDQTSKAPSSSSALREQIAKAKAARKKAATNKQAEPRNDIPIGDAALESYEEDPFNQMPKGGEAVIKNRVATARSEGRLNLANMGLTEIPQQVMTMYEYDPNNSVSTWAETVDLTRFIAADNEIERLPDDLFPDVDPLEASEDFDASPNQFGGVEMLDLHGNILKQLPIGMRRLENLSVLNLTRNQLDNSSLEVISQISGLRELKLADNEFEGPFPDTIGLLENLEVLELQGNKINHLPYDLRLLSNLRVLNVAKNQLSSLPMDVLHLMPLVELVASKNALRGTLFPATVSKMPRLQILDVSGNALTALSDNRIALPELRTLNVAINRLEHLPDMTEWARLMTFLAEENKLSEFPQGFKTLGTLRRANLSGNNIVKIEPEVGLMERLEVLNLAANPLSERKFLTMGTGDLKFILKSRIAPAGHDDGVTSPGSVREDETNGAIQKGSTWTLRGSGILDLSSKGLTELDGGNLAEVADKTRQLVLHHNKFTSIPATVSLASGITMLDLSHNCLSTAFAGSIELPSLRELRLLGNGIISFDSLVSYLIAPRLQHLDLTANRLSGALPTLLSFYPELATLLVSDNSIEEISAEALSGLKAVNLSNNSIGRVPPEIGLLWDQGLRSLELEGNTFRIPNYTILRKGTEEVMRWLRDKVPRELPEEEDETF